MSNEAAYIWGMCTYGVAKWAPWVPRGLGNAIDWLSNAQAKGLETSSTPHPGDVAVYGRSYGPDGHVALVEEVNADGTFLAHEMNFTGLNKEDRRVSTLNGVLGFIRPPAAAAASAATAARSGGIPGAITGAANALTGLLARGMWLALAVVLIVLGLFLLVAEEIAREVKEHPEAVEAAALA